MTGIANLQAFVRGLQYASPVPGVRRVLDYSRAPSPVLRVYLDDGSSTALHDLGDRHGPAPQGTLRFEVRLPKQVLNRNSAFHPYDLDSALEAYLMSDYWERAGLHSDVVSLGCLTDAFDERTFDSDLEPGALEEAISHLLYDYHRGLPIEDLATRSSEPYRVLSQLGVAVAPSGVEEVPEYFWRELDLDRSSVIDHWG